MSDILRLKNISQEFEDDNRKLLALKNISLTIKSGEFLMLLGPSGCGKSTLLRIMSHLQKPSRGTFAFRPDIYPADISFVFQQFALLPWLTVYQNVELGLIARHIDMGTRQKIVQRELSKLRLSKFKKAFPHELSGGMRQRVGIARALVTDPKIIFMDEPFSELDSFTAEELRQELLAIWQERKMTVVMVTHIVQEAIELADRIAVMTSRPGKIDKIIINKLERPRHKRSQGFYDMEDEITQLLRVAK